jgi:calcium-independent phospholipase A2
MEGIDVDLNAPNVDGDAPVHGIIRRKRRKRADLLMTLLVNGCSRVDVNQCSLSSGDTALHLAVMEEDEELVKMLLIFGAEVNPLNNHCQTPLDLAISRESCNTVAMLISVDGKTGDALLSEEDGPATIWKLEPFNQPFDTDNDLVNGVHDSHNEHDPPQVEGNGSEDCDAAGWEVVDDGSAMGDAPERGPCAGSEELVFSGGGWREVILKDLEEGKASSTLYQKLSEYINAHLTFSESLGTSVDEAIAMTKQQRELLRYQKTQHFPSSLTRPRAGSRVLCLDGGGVRGLIQIEVLRQLELRTGAKVTEIFDWIVGTSTGGILALGLVYAKKNLSELRQLYFKLRDHVFSAGRMGMGYNTESFERVLKQEFGTEALMSDVSYPRVLITAVYKKTNQPELHLLNNCFDNEFSKYPVWKVARYTSAAPLFFSELDHYVDGAVLANNPCDYALTAINNYFK